MLRSEFWEEGTTTFNQTNAVFQWSKHTPFHLVDPTATTLTILTWSKLVTTWSQFVS